jgi:hypothetical protein
MENQINPLSPQVEKILSKLKQGKEDFVNYYGKDAEKVMVDKAIKISNKMNKKNIEELVKSALTKHKTTLDEARQKAYDLRIQMNLKEDIDIGHEDDEPNMIKADLYQLRKDINDLCSMVEKYDNINTEIDFPAWWQEKITTSKAMLSGAKEYLDFESNDASLEEKKLTKAEKNKKEKIVKGMKDNFKGSEAAMYAIATDKAKKLQEEKEVKIAGTISKGGKDSVYIDTTDGERYEYQTTPEEYQLFINSGGNAQKMMAKSWLPKATLHKPSNHPLGRLGMGKGHYIDEAKKLAEIVIKKLKENSTSNKKEGWFVKSNDLDTKYVVVHTSEVENRSNRISDFYKDKKTAEKRADFLNKKLKESNNKEEYIISKSGPKSNPHYVLEKPDGSKQIDMMFDSPEDAKTYAKKKNLKTK